MKLQCILTNTENETMRNVAIMLLRVLAGGFLLTHGLAKLSNFEALSQVFPDPIGLGSTVSLVLVLVAEVLCAVLVIVGFFTRLAVLPILFAMGVAAFVIHANEPFAGKELALFYLGVFVVLFFTGSGKYAVDTFIKDCFYID